MSITHALLAACFLWAGAHAKCRPGEDFDSATGKGCPKAEIVQKNAKLTTNEGNLIVELAEGKKVA